MLRPYRTGPRQLWLILLGVVGLASVIALGIERFGAENVRSNKRGIALSLQGVAAKAYQYRIRPTILGGGGNSYVNFEIPSGLKSDRYGSYSVEDTPAVSSIVLLGVSAFDTDWVASCRLDSAGNTRVTFTGW